MPIIAFIKKDKWFAAFCAALAVLLVFFLLYLGPHPEGDTQSYINAMQVLAGQTPPAGFIPNRIITTFFGMESIRALAPVFGGMYPAWFFINCSLYILACLFFFKLIRRLFRSDAAAFFGGLFLAANYGFLLFGLNYLLDIGGWSFYIFSLYLLLAYSQSKDRRDLFLSALMIGIGGLFKEYAFLAAVAIAAYLILEAWPSLKTAAGWRSLAARAIPSAALALVPAAILYIWAYRHFGYTYANWFGANAEHYIYHSRIIEYIKSLGSLVNVLAFMFLGGICILVKKWRELDREAKIFISAVFVSFLPVFAWPAITQRILSITIPFIVLVSCFLFRRYERRWYLFLPILLVYILATFFMDSYILTAVNLPL